MIFVNVKTLTMLMLFLERLAGDLLGCCGRPGAVGHHCSRAKVFSTTSKKSNSEGGQTTTQELVKELGYQQPQLKKSEVNEA